MFQVSDEIVNEFIDLFERSRETQFGIGDRLLELEREYGCQRSELVNALAGALRVMPSTLYDYMRISERWTEDSRLKYPALDWTIYRNADPSKDEALLNRAMDEGWNSSTFKEEKFPTMTMLRNIIVKIKSMLQKNRPRMTIEHQEIVDHIMSELAALEEEL